jgi:hypothetical protein
MNTDIAFELVLAHVAAHEGEGYDRELFDGEAALKVARYLVQNGYSDEDFSELADDGVVYTLYDFAKFGA